MLLNRAEYICCKKPPQVVEDTEKRRYRLSPSPVTNRTRPILPWNTINKAILGETCSNQGLRYFLLEWNCGNSSTSSRRKWVKPPVEPDAKRSVGVFWNFGGKIMEPVGAGFTLSDSEGLLLISCVWIFNFNQQRGSTNANTISVVSAMNFDIHWWSEKLRTTGSLQTSRTLFTKDTLDRNKPKTKRKFHELVTGILLIPDILDKASLVWPCLTPEPLTTEDGQTECISGPENQTHCSPDQLNSCFYFTQAFPSKVVIWEFGWWASGHFTMRPGVPTSRRSTPAKVWFAAMLHQSFFASKRTIPFPSIIYSGLRNNGPEKYLSSLLKQELFLEVLPTQCFHDLQFTKLKKRLVF